MRPPVSAASDDKPGKGITVAMASQEVPPIFNVDPSQCRVAQMLSNITFMCFTKMADTFKLDFISVENLSLKPGSSAAVVFLAN